ncbi:hypothetical protein SRHO_G00330630 [Serrasalmus rhombeus]
MRSVFVGLVLFALVPLNDAACFTALLNAGATHCQDLLDKTWHPVGSSWTNSKCDQCGCSADGMRCCDGMPTVHVTGDCTVRSVFVGLVLFALVPLNDAACFTALPKGGATHCQDLLDKTWHPLGSSWTNSKCDQCGCSADGMRCCDGLPSVWLTKLCGSLWSTIMTHAHLKCLKRATGLLHALSAPLESDQKRQQVKAELSDSVRWWR